MGLRVKSKNKTGLRLEIVALIALKTVLIGTEVEVFGPHLFANSQAFIPFPLEKRGKWERK